MRKGKHSNAQGEREEGGLARKREGKRMTESERVRWREGDREHARELARRVERREEAKKETLWRYRDRKFSHNSTGTGLRSADYSGTGTRIDG